MAEALWLEKRYNLERQNAKGEGKDEKDRQRHRCTNPDTAEGNCRLHFYFKGAQAKLDQLTLEFFKLKIVLICLLEISFILN